MEGLPNPIASPLPRDYGTTCSWLVGDGGPVWWQSRNITRTLGVTPETAEADLAKEIAADDRTYKRGAIPAKAKPAGGSAAVPYQDWSERDIGAADAR